MNPRQQKFLFGILAFAFAAFTSLGQPVLVSPPPPPPAQEPVEQSSDTNGVSTSHTSLAGGASRNMNPFQWGPVVLHPGLAYGLSYGTGLQSQPGQSHASLIQTLSPSLGCDVGPHWHFGYSATATFYSESSFHNAVDHSLSLGWQTTYEDWSFRLSQTAALSSDPQVATAQQTDQQVYTTGLGISRQLGGDFSLDLSAGQTITDASGFTNTVSSSGPVGGTKDWTAMAWLNYHWGPYLTTGVGVGGGYNAVTTGSDMTYEDYQGRISWRFARKLTLSLNGGAQVRQFHSEQPDLLTPIFGVGLTYQPFEPTVITLSANRSVTASYYFVSQVTETTSVSLGLSQRLFGKYSLGLGGGYVNSSYQESSILGSTSREDNYSYFSASISRGFLTHGTVSLSYSASQNSSNQGGYTYSSSQIGLSVSYGY